MILERLPSSIHDFLKEVESLGFVLTLVGGIPRDFLSTDHMGSDFDFEIRSSAIVSANDWPVFYQRLIDHLRKKNFQFKILPYLITRVDLGPYQLEFSSPRIEKNLDENFSHHHFEAVLDSQLPYKDSFKRRDFTINAIGIKLDLANGIDELIDPYNGLNDLKGGILKPISDDFYHDSVRFLRLIRFQLKFNRFVMDAELINNLGQFNLSQLSQHYFKEEMFKSFPGKFLNLFNKLVKDHQLKIPKEFEVFGKYHFSPEIMTKEQLLGFVYLQDKKEATQVAHFFNLPVKTLKDLESFMHSFEILSSATETQLKLLATKPEEEALSDSFFKETKNCEDKKIWFEHLHLKRDGLLFGPEDWKDNEASPEEWQNVKPAQRSYLPFLKALKKKYNS